MAGAACGQRGGHRPDAHTDAGGERAYYLPLPIPDDAVSAAHDSIRDLRLLDPAVGSGHFLVVALDLLVALYREEARHRGEEGAPRWSDAAIVERILSHNLHGIDLDGRAVEIARGGAVAEGPAGGAGRRPARLNLVAANLRLASLPDDDRLVELRREVERETGIPGSLTDTLVGALQGRTTWAACSRWTRRWTPHCRPRGHPGPSGPGGADVRPALRPPADPPRHRSGGGQGHPARPHRGLPGPAHRRRRPGPAPAGRAGAAGLLRPHGEGGTYDLVVANPPYQGTSKMADPEASRAYPLGKADLYAAFLLPELELVKRGACRRC